MLCSIGRQVVVLETMNGIMTQPKEVEPFFEDPWHREHFKSPALANVDKLSKQRPQDYMSLQGLAQVGLKTQLDQVMRWKPRMVSSVSPCLAPPSSLLILIQYDYSLTILPNLVLIWFSVPPCLQLSVLSRFSMEVRLRAELPERRSLEG